MSIDEEELTDLHKAEDREPSPDRPPVAQGADEQRTRLGLRDRIPALGLTEYWYPAIHARKVSVQEAESAASSSARTSCSSAGRRATSWR